MTARPSGESSQLVYLPWPMVMDIADACDANGYRQLAREARQAVWQEAERRFNADERPLQGAIERGDYSMADEGERCQVCGDTYTDVYRLPDEWWALVTPKPEHPEAGLLCPPCALSRLMICGVLSTLSPDVLPTRGAEHE